MTTTKVPTEIMLPRLHAWCAAIVGLLMIAEAAVLYFAPPVRDTIESTIETGRKIEKRLSTEADPTTLVIALSTAGAALVVYGMNGIRILRVSMSNVNVETLGALSEPAEKMASSTPPQKSSVPSDVMITFLLRSSWNGLKILKACQLAWIKGKPKFNLKLSPVLGPHTSYEYCYGFLIASLSVGAIIGSADAETGLVEIVWIDETLAREIDGIMNGNIAVDPNLAAFKAGEMAALVAYFEKL